MIAPAHADHRHLNAAPQYSHSFLISAFESDRNPDYTCNPAWEEPWSSWNDVTGRICEKVAAKQQHSLQNACASQCRLPGGPQVQLEDNGNKDGHEHEKYALDGQEKAVECCSGSRAGGLEGPYYMHAIVPALHMQGVLSGITEDMRTVDCPGSIAGKAPYPRPPRRLPRRFVLACRLDGYVSERVTGKRNSNAAAAAAASPLPREGRAHRMLASRASRHRDATATGALNAAALPAGPRSRMLGRMV